VVITAFAAKHIATALPQRPRREQMKKDDIPHDEVIDRLK